MFRCIHILNIYIYENTYIVETMAVGGKYRVVTCLMVFLWPTLGLQAQAPNTMINNTVYNIIIYSNIYDSII